MGLRCARSVFTYSLWAYFIYPSPAATICVGFCSFLFNHYTNYSNAELVEQIIDFDFMSTSAQNIVNDASKGIATAGHAVADALGVVNAIVSTGAWDTFNDVLGIADGFAKLVRPVVDPLSPITDLLRKEIKTLWIGKVYRKKNLGKVGCRSKSDVGYDSKKGAFGDKCWQRVRRLYHFVFRLFGILRYLGMRTSSHLRLSLIDYSRHSLLNTFIFHRLK